MRPIVDKFLALNRQQRQKTDLVASIEQKSFVNKSRPRIRAAIKRRKKNSTARLSRRINRT